MVNEAMGCTFEDVRGGRLLPDVSARTSGEAEYRSHGEDMIGAAGEGVGE
jgi:hypothetical protein